MTNWKKKLRTPTYEEVSLYSWHPVYFVWIQLLHLCWISISFTCLIESKPVKQEASRTVILPPTYGECSLVEVNDGWWLCKYNEWRPGGDVGNVLIATCWQNWVVDVTQLVERSLPTPEVNGSNTVIGKILNWTFALNYIEKTENKKRPVMAY